MNPIPTLWHNTFETEVYSPNLVYFYEPLPTKAPTSGVQPYCSYVRQVIFYKFPYQVNQWGGYERYDQVDTAWDLLGQRWTSEDIGWAGVAPFVEHEGVIYELVSGRVCLRSARWEMHWRARRVADDDHRLVAFTQEDTKL